MRYSHTDIYLSVFYGTQVHLEVLMKKSFHKMLLDVVEKLLCFMFINYRDISPSWEGGKYNLLHHRTRNSSLGAVGSGLFVDSMCVFHFFSTERKNLEGGGSEIQFTGKMESQHRCQEWKIVSVDKWKKFAVWGWQMCFCPWHCVTADEHGWHPANLFTGFFFSNLKILQYNRLERQEA